jgi:hypothetical protein
MFSPSFLTLDFCKDFNHSDVHGVWAAHRLKPHLKRGSSFRGPNLCEKVRHIVGVHLDPPDTALVRQTLLRRLTVRQVVNFDVVKPIPSR